MARWTASAIPPSATGTVLVGAARVDDLDAHHEAAAPDVADDRKTLGALAQRVQQALAHRRRMAREVVLDDV